VEKHQPSRPFSGRPSRLHTLPFDVPSTSVLRKTRLPGAAL
jgi:hypothetical protein